MKSRENAARKKVGDSEVTKQSIEALSREIDKLEERIKRKREGVRSFYV